MRKSLVTVIQAFTIGALGMLVSGSAQAGASASAPLKYSTKTHTMSASQPTTVRPKQAGINEFSSSARTSVPKR